MVLSILLDISLGQSLLLSECELVSYFSKGAIMSTWKQREAYLIKVSQRYLQGHKTFDLCRSHLVKESHISKGTIYNHFASDADLIVAIGLDDIKHRLEHVTLCSQHISDPLCLFLYHHCWRIYDVLVNRRFVIERIFPNEVILTQASSEYQKLYLTKHQQYTNWFHSIISAMGKIEGFDRADLVINYLRGALVNIDDARKDGLDPQLYLQFCYAIIQLLGHSDKRLPSIDVIKSWLNGMAQQDKAA